MQPIRFAHVFGKPRSRLKTSCGLASKKPQQRVTLVMMLQTMSCTLSNEVHALTISRPYKETQQSLSMRTLHYHTMPLKDEALQHLWQTSKLSLTLVI